MTSGYIEYDGNQKLAKAYEQVRLTNQSMELTTDTLYFDREQQESYYRDYGTIVDSANTLTSRVGRYYMVTKKYQFQDSVLIENPEYTMESSRLDYYTTSKNAYMYGPSTIIAVEARSAQTPPQARLKKIPARGLYFRRPEIMGLRGNDITSVIRRALSHCMATGVARGNACPQGKIGIIEIV